MGTGEREEIIAQYGVDSRMIFYSLLYLRNDFYRRAV